MADVKNMKVNHKTLGEGMVLEQTENRLWWNLHLKLFRSSIQVHLKAFYQ